MASEYFPVDVPEPCSILGAEISEWYRIAVSHIPKFIDLKAPDEDTPNAVWDAMSRLRFAGAIGLCDPELAPDFFKDNPLPGIKDLLETCQADIA